jgi:hypothetical protein|tara:strand:- start:240 stop:389 length:150 start_codon:yes stop_codon:yes gene_type:complete
MVASRRGKPDDKNNYFYAHFRLLLPSLSGWLFLLAKLMGNVLSKAATGR